jgi:CubicO group peptidase (beta-lactamase class C family)
MIDERTRRLLDLRLATDQAEQRLPSVAAGLARDGELAWSAGRGRIPGDDGQAAGVRPDADTQYRAGSITKTFVAVAVLRLRDAGRLSLSDPIGGYLDAGAAGAMTIGQLLSHSAGLRAETAGPWWERTAGSSFADLAGSSLGPEAARFRPGRRHHYSNVGYGMLGAMVGALHGRPWQDVVAIELLAPLGMTRTTTRPQRPFAPGFAVHPHADVLLAEPEHDAGAMAPAGQLWTTIGDLARWGRFLAGDSSGLLAAATLEEMREPIVIAETTGDPWTSGYGLGLQLWNAGGVRYYGHTGSMPGFIALLQITDGPGSDTALAACNSTTGFSFSLGSDLLATLADCEPRCPDEWAPAEVSDDLLGLLGTWYWGPARFALRLTDDTLELRSDTVQGRGFRFRRQPDGTWLGIDGYQAGEPLTPVYGPGGTTAIALDVGSFIFTRTPYDPAAPVPGGVHPEGWHSPRYGDRH